MKKKKPEHSEEEGAEKTWVVGGKSVNRHYYHAHQVWGLIGWQPLISSRLD